MATIEYPGFSHKGTTRMRQLILVLCLSVSACSPLWRDSYPQPRREPCEVILKDDQHHGACVSRETMKRWVCRELGELCDNQ